MNALTWTRGALSIPFLVAALVLPYVGGFLLAYLLIVLTLLLCLWLLPARVAPRIEAAGGLFLGAFALLAAAFFANGNFPLAGNFAMFALFAPLAAALSQSAGPANATLVARLALLGAAGASCVAVWEVFALGHGRASGFGSDPIWSAQAVVALGFVALIGVPQAARFWRLLYWLGPFLGTVTALLAGSRGPLLTVPVLVVAGVLLTARRWWLALPLTVVAGVAAVGIAAAVQPESFARLTSLTTMAGEIASGHAVSEVSSGQRLAFYQSGLAAFLERPLFGYGWDQKVNAIRPYLSDGGAMLEEGHHHLHSDVLDFGVSAGLLGLLAYGMVIAAPVAGALASPRDRQFRARLVGAAVLALGYLIFGLTYLTFGYEFHTTLYVCLAAIVVGYCRDTPLARSKTASR